MAKEGFATIAFMAIAVILIWVGVYFTKSGYTAAIAIIFTLIFLLSVYFFRDPNRKSPAGDNLVLSPADGRVVEIVNENENLFVKEPVVRVSIFLSVFNVHVNRIPISGQVAYFDYKKGKFLAAFKRNASIENEQTIIGIQTPHGRVLFKQIAGFIARRIVCNIRLGDKVTGGDRFGIIKFGSRADIMMPQNGTTILVKKGQTVKAGQTIIGKINEKS